MATAGVVATSAPVSQHTEELYRRHGRMVAGLCCALLRDRAMADDATQQVFLSAHRALLNGSVPHQPAAWLATIARNECRARALLRTPEPLSLDGVERASPLPDPLEEAIRRADLAALWRAIRQLPKPQQEALLLREFGGLTYRELAEALSVSGGAVESLLFRARQRLRETFATAGEASWLQPILRVLAGGSAPLAAKAATLGLGAATLSGGAVLIPRTFSPTRPQNPLGAAPQIAHPTRRAWQTPSTHGSKLTTAPAPETQTRRRSQKGVGESAAAAADTEARTPPRDSASEPRSSEEQPAPTTTQPSEPTLAASDPSSTDSGDLSSPSSEQTGQSDPVPTESSTSATSTSNPDSRTGSDSSH